jgi:ABC-type multidrug transport system ATPase subunit
MLGLLQPTRGTMRFFGRPSIDSLRHRVGVCPQHDILFDKLTAREHLVYVVLCLLLFDEAFLVGHILSSLACLVD